jgi:16S rRNA (cytidine1402-2'-O)-methyltransferase
MLEDALEILGNRPAVIAREVTKMYEEFLRGHLQELLAEIRKKPARGEITLLIAPADEQTSRAENFDQSQNGVPLSHRVGEIMKAEGVERKAALKQAARERGLTRREAYKQLLVTRDEL